MKRRLINLLKSFLNKRRRSYRCTKTYMRYFHELDVDDNIILFEAYQGTRIACNPLAIFKYMVDNPEYEDYTFVWGINDKNNYYAKKYAKRDDVIFCKKDSKEYLKYLASAKYLINNKTFSYFFIKKPEQIYVNSWHSVALKKLGKHQEGRMGQYKNVTKNYIQTDYLVVPNNFMTDVLLDCCDIMTHYNGLVIDEGYPRTDLSYNTPMQEMRNYLHELLGVDITKKIVLYAPTWRGEVGASIDITDDILQHVLDINKDLPGDCVLLLKVHDRTYTFVKDNPELQKVANVPDWLDSNELLAGIDILITDYSGIFFDFLKLKRPIIFFAYDRELYEKERGMYMDFDTMPGPICYTAKEVTDTLANIDEIYPNYEDKHTHMLEEYCYREDGNCTQRVVDIIFKGKYSPNVYSIEKTKKPRVLIYVGSFRSRADSAELVSSLNKIDFTQLDITLYFNANPNIVDEVYLKRLNPNIHIIYRCPWQLYRYYQQAIKSAKDESAFRDGYLTEESIELFTRFAFDDIQFDLVIDTVQSQDAWRWALPTIADKSIVYINQNLSFKRYIDELMLERYDKIIISPINFGEQVARKVGKEKVIDLSCDICINTDDVFQFGDAIIDMLELDKAGEIPADDDFTPPTIEEMQEEAILASEMLKQQRQQKKTSQNNTFKARLKARLKKFIA